MISRDVVIQEMHDLISQPNYPCVAAVQSMKTAEYQIGMYSKFGSGEARAELARDLLKFKRDQISTNSTFLSFWAVYPDAASMNEDEFEKAMWAELSAVDSIPEYQKPWDPNFSSNPEDKNFCFSFDGTAFFVVGAHPASSRKARQFRYPSIIFNLYDQFNALDEMGKYVPMVKAIRQRDTKFQGDVNPMVEQYADKWEAIQFSGKMNSPEWKCPFLRAQHAQQTSK